MKSLRHSLPLVATLVAGGCSMFQPAKDEAASLVTPALPQPRAFRDISLDGSSIRRLLALPLSDVSGIGAPTDVVSASLRDEIIKLRRFDVVQPDASDATSKPSEGPKSTGRIEIATILELGRRYGVDAVLFGAIDHYRPYAPPKLGISAALVDVQTGQIVWEVRDFLDASDRETEVAMDQYFRAEAAHDQTIQGGEVLSSSPSWFARFATRRIARTLMAAPTTDVPR